MKKILLSLAFLAGVSLTVSAQFKIGGKTINTKKVINAATDVAHAATLSDEDVAKMAKEYIQWMDTHNEVAGPDTEMGQRLERLTANVKKVSGLDLNFKVYNVVDVNAFACGDGSVRVCGGLMKIMDDDEVFAVIGHEIGHVLHTDSKDAMKQAYEEYMAEEPCPDCHGQRLKPEALAVTVGSKNLAQVSELCIRLSLIHI